MKQYFSSYKILIFQHYVGVFLCNDTCLYLLHCFPGNEYESPWDLEAEINQVAKQMQSSPVSPLTSNTHSLSSQKSTVDVTSAHSNKPQDSLQRLHHQQSLKKVERSETKIDYSKQSKLISPSSTGSRDISGSGSSSGGMMSAHKVRQPHVHRQSSTSSMTGSMAAPSTSSVLVEGEWRQDILHSDANLHYYICYVYCQSRLGPLSIICHLIFYPYVHITDIVACHYAAL